MNAWVVGLSASVLAIGLVACAQPTGTGPPFGDAAETRDGAAQPPQDGGPADASGPGVDAAALPPLRDQRFLIGYNEAWFGSNFGTDYTSNFDLAYVQRTFDGIVAGGGHLVRLFLWEVPQGYDLADSPPQTRAVSPAFLKNVDTVLWEARRRGLFAYVTLLDANTIAKIVGPLHTYGVNLLNNSGGERDAFNQNALGPLLTVLDGHRDMLFGIDIINEIQAAYKNGVFPDAKAGPRAFIQAEVAFIKSRLPWVRVTASAGWAEDLLRTGGQYDIANGFYAGLGLDFYDLHAYSDSGTYPGATALCARAAADGVPVYLGEFGQKSHTTDDTLQYNATASFLNNGASLCFKGAFGWRFDPTEPWLAFTRADQSPRPAVTIMQTFGAL